MNAGIVHLYPSIHPIRPSVHPSIRPLPTHAPTYPQFIIYRFAFKYSSDPFPTSHLSEKASKGSFFGPDKLKTHTNEGKEQEKRKSEA